MRGDVADFTTCYSSRTVRSPRQTLNNLRHILAKRVFSFPHKAHNHHAMGAIRFPLLIPLGLFLAGSLISLAASYDRSLSMPFVLSVWGAAFLYLLLVWWCRTPNRIRRAAEVVIAIATLGALVLFLQYRHLGFEPQDVVATRIGQATSALFPAFLPIAVQQNVAASFLEGCLPLAIGLWWPRGHPRRHIWLGCALVIGAGLFLTASRGALLALLVCAGVAGLFWLATHRQRLVWYGVLGGGGLLLGLVILTLTTPLLQAAPIQSLIARGADRAILYRNSLFLALDAPFTGIGPGNTFAMMYSRYVLLIDWRYLTYAHNIFLAVWLAQGLVGLLGFGGMIVATTRLMWQAAQWGANALWFGVALGSLAILLHGLSDAPQYNPDGWWAMLMGWAILAIAIASAQQQIAAAAPTRRTRRWPALSLRQQLALVSVLAALVVLVSGRSIMAMAAVNMGAIAEARADLNPNVSDEQRATLASAATDWYHTALHWDPTNASALRRLGIRATADLRTNEAIPLLEAAASRAPANQASWKALGYAYLWEGRVAAAVELFSQLDRTNEVHDELGTWHWFWNQRERTDLAAYAAEAQQRLGHMLR